MVITGLLLIALVCLGLGLAMQSSVWLVASLIASAGAGLLLYKLRDVIAAPKRAIPAAGSGPDSASEAEGPAAAPTESGSASPDAAAQAEPEADGLVADEPPTGRTGVDADPVWVVHGRPRYHLGDCAIIQDEDAEAISFEQAGEDGFMPCSLCEPHAARTP